MKTKGFVDGAVEMRAVSDVVRVEEELGRGDVVGYFAELGLSVLVSAEFPEEPAERCMGGVAACVNCWAEVTEVGD